MLSEETFKREGKGLAQGHTEAQGKTGLEFMASGFFLPLQNFLQTEFIPLSASQTSFPGNGSLES